MQGESDELISSDDDSPPILDPIFPLSLPIPSFPYPTPVFPPSTSRYVPIQPWNPSTHSIPPKISSSLLTSTRSSKKSSTTLSPGPSTSNIDLNVFNHVAPLAPLTTRFGTFAPRSSSDSVHHESSPCTVLPPAKTSCVDSVPDPPRLSPITSNNESFTVLSTSSYLTTQEKLIEDLLMLNPCDPLIGSAAIMPDPGPPPLTSFEVQHGLVPDPQHQQFLAERLNSMTPTKEGSIDYLAAIHHSAKPSSPYVSVIRETVTTPIEFFKLPIQIASTSGDVTEKYLDQPSTSKWNWNEAIDSLFKTKSPRTIDKKERLQKITTSKEESDPIASWDEGVVLRQQKAFGLLEKTTNKIGLVDKRERIFMPKRKKLNKDEFFEGVLVKVDAKLKAAINGAVWNGRKKKRARGRGAKEKNSQQDLETREYCEKVKLDYKWLGALEKELEAAAFNEPFNGDREFVKDVAECVRDLTISVSKTMDFGEGIGKRKGPPRTPYLDRKDLAGAFGTEYNLRKGIETYYGHLQ